MAEFEGSPRLSPASFSTATKGYVGLGSSVGGNDFADLWEYDPETDAWKSMASFPRENYSSSSFLLGANGKGYLATGFGTINMLEFNPGTNTWTALPGELNSNFVGYPHFADAGFVVNDRLFVFFADQTTAANPVYEYDLATSTWINHGAPEAVDNLRNLLSVGFALGDNGYIIGRVLPSTIYKLNTGTGSWEIKPGSSSIGTSGCFTLNGKAYFTGMWLNPGYQLWEYDPSFD
jgi:hypothetical protein